MTARTTRIALAAGACAALALGALPAAAHADTVVRFDGWVTTPGFADPMPFPTVHYTGTVDAKGWITVRPDCIKGALGGPAAPCVDNPGTRAQIATRTLSWWNDGKRYGGEVKARPDGSFTTLIGEKKVTFTVGGPGTVGKAIGRYSA
ncbi:hypothetical protein LB823_12540 [Tsukamurella sp. M9C]|uniref:hypothetical protein n=1 Tax=Tsukamurella sp. M9C TaxID=2877520 RepID=UPI001CCAB105|nr:hypothetical protein [Tsukamurella sp. M9C]MCA0157030.1 hypothetical protein [Tsukamurella sp. M9C]